MVWPLWTGIRYTKYPSADVIMLPLLQPSVVFCAFTCAYIPIYVKACVQIPNSAYAEYHIQHMLICRHILEIVKISFGEMLLKSLKLLVNLATNSVYAWLPRTHGTLLNSDTPSPGSKRIKVWDIYTCLRGVQNSAHVNKNCLSELFIIL